MSKIYLVDVSSFIFRAFYAIRPLTAPSGLPVNAIYGFLTMILKLLREEKPEYIVFCFDRGEASFRHELSEDYKANRNEMPEDLSPQMPYFRRIGEVLGIPCIDMEGFEADDVIGTLTRFGRSKDFDVVIVSGDKDFAQLVDGHVCMYDTMKNVRYHSEQVKEKWGVLPEQMRDYLAIVGDTSDNIAGVHGIGPKGAVKLLEEYGSLDNVYKNIEKIKGATKDKLIASKDNALLAQKLVTIHCDMPLSKDWKDYELKPAHSHEVETLLDELNFKTLRPTLYQLPNWTINGELANSSNKSQMNGEQTPLPAISEVKHSQVEVGPSVTFEDPVSGGPEAFAKTFGQEKELWLSSVSTGLFLASESTGKVLQLSGELEQWRKVLADAKVRFHGFDLKKTFHEMLAEAPHAGWDSMLASYVLKPGEPTDWNSVVLRWLHETPVDALSIASHFSEQVRLQRTLKHSLEEMSALKVYSEIELPLIEVLYGVERHGVRLDIPLLQEQGKALEKEIRNLEKQIYKLADGEFNVGSPKQLGQILFEKLKLPAGRKTKTGFSTDSEVLEKLRKHHPIADLILNYREVTKLKSTYVDTLPSLVKADGRVHTTFNQALTTTGRLSSQDPNLQNIPIRTETGAAVRRAFVAGEGCELLSADYSQIELRILAHYSEDKNLSKAFEEDLDVHALTASEVFSTPLKDVTSDQRRSAKAINFGIAYGQGAFGLADNLGIPRNEAQEIIQRYFTRFPGVATYIQSTIESAKSKGYVETLFGRRRYIDELRSANPTMRKFGERAAINAPIQGTAADIVKKAMIDLSRKVKSKMILQVHDELLFEASPSQLREEKPQIVKGMENAVQLRVPLKVNSEQALNWQEAH